METDHSFAVPWFRSLPRAGAYMCLSTCMGSAHRMFVSRFFSLKNKHTHLGFSCFRGCSMILFMVMINS